MKLKIWEISLAIALVVTLLGGFVVDRDRQELSDKLIRLHVVANSDSEEDQAVKLEVRDAVLVELEALLRGVTDRTEALDIIGESLDELGRTADRTLRSRGFDYGAAAAVAAESFPTREYETFSLPAGEYTSLRIRLGGGGGQNWWCVVFPPLCMSAATGEDFSAVSLSEDEISLITGEDSGYVVKFKVMELLENFRQWFRHETG